MPKFTAQVKRVKTGKSYADPQVEITLLVEGFPPSFYDVIADLTKISLLEQNDVELEYKK